MGKGSKSTGATHGSGITRRGFLVGGAAALGSIFLPEVAGARGSFVVPIYAESKVMVVGRKEIGIAVVDCAEGPLLPVEGATVRIESFYNRMYITGTSDASGKITLDVSELAEKESEDSPASEGGKKEEYCFNGRITVTRKGYRDVVIARTRLRSVSAIIAPTRRLEEGAPYIRQLSFDGWDIQYTKATFLADESNSGMHTLMAEVWVPPASSVDVRFYCEFEDEETGKKSVKDIGEETLKESGAEGGFQRASFEEAFLDPAFPKKALPADCTVHVALTCNNTVYDQICGLSVKEPPIAESASGEVTLAPGTFYDDSLSIFTLPSSLPAPLGGSSFSIWKPVFDNIGFDFSPAGYLMVGFTIGSMSAMNDNGKATDKDAWMEWPEETAGEQYKRVTDKMCKKIDRVKDMYSSLSDAGGLFQHSCSSFISATGSFQIFANLDYDWDTKYWGGSLSAVVGGVVDGSWTIQMLVVAVPIFISFDASAELNAGLRFAAKTYGSSVDELFKNITYDADSSTISVTANIEIGLSLGVGVAGVASVYIRGAGWITTNIAFYQGAPEAKSPRLTAGVGLSASIGVQLLLFKWSGPIWEEEWPDLVDTASSEVSTMSLNAGRAVPSLADIASQMSIVTNDELLGVREFEANPSALQTMSVVAPAEVASRDLGDGCIEWEMPQIAENAAAQSANTSKPKGLSPLGRLRAMTGNDEGYLDKSATGADPTANIGIAGLGAGIRGGIKPTADTVVFKNIFSDPKLKVVRFGSRDVMLRLASVGYGDKARTRLTYSIAEGGAWGKPHVIDFDCAGVDIARGELYDYDFDAAVVGFWEKYLYVMVISGTRPEGDATSFTTANSKTIISLVRIYDANFPDAPLAVSSAISWEAFKISSSAKSSYSFSLPHLVAYTDSGSYDNETNSCLIGTCIVRQATNAGKLVEQGARCYLLSFFAEHRRGETPKVITKGARVTPSGVDHVTMGPVAFPDAPQSSIRAPKRHVNVGVTGNPSGNNVCSGVWGVVVSYDDTKGSYSIGIERRVEPQGNYDVCRLYPTGNDGEFYAIRTAGTATPSDSGEFERSARLYLASYAADSYGDFSFTPVGPADFSPSELAVSGDGRYLYFAVNKEGAAGRDAKADGTLSSPKESNTYRIMAMARVEGLFTQPFVLCELDHPVDYVVSMTSMGAAATLIAAETTDADASRASIHDIRVPLAVCATPVSVTTAGPFVYAGEESDFNVEVRNDGNTIVSGFTAELLDGTGSVVDSTQVTLDAAVLANDGDVENGKGEESVYEVESLPHELAQSPLVAASNGQLLAPGKTACYRVSFAIPTSWSAERTVRVRIANGSVRIIEPQSTLSVMSDEGDDASGEDSNDFIENWEADLFADPDRSFKLKKKSLPSFDVSVLKSAGFDDTNLVRADYIEHAANSGGFKRR